MDPRISKDERLFNVDMNGARVATGVSRDEASVYQVARRVAGTGSCYVYLMDKPLTGRRAAWRAPSIPRLPGLKVSAATRQKLRDALLIDGTLIEPDYVIEVAAPESVAA